MTNSKRIFKNTIILYVRMIIVLLISLYTSRIILKALGVDDFGLYNVVGGVVGVLTFFNGTMSKATQRFLNVAMVKTDTSLGSIFASSITVHLLIAIVFFILGETVGLWFLNTKIVIPIGRELAANIVYQATVLSFCISILTIPYSAAVIAFEKVSFLAFVSIFDAVLKLVIAFYLLYTSGDRLALYGVLHLIISTLNFILYFLFCKRYYPVLQFRLSFEKDNFKQIFSFVSWTLIGQFAVVGCNQGNIVLVNMFHSLAANAAMTVGSQINNAVNNLTTNFQTAFNPQITKSYAEGNFDYLKSLVYTTSKISFCILFVVGIPLAFNINWVLDLWLDVVPHLSNVFAISLLVNGILNALSMPFNFTVLSSGRIRNFQLVTALFFLMDLPVTYVLFKHGFPAPTVLVVKICAMVAILFVRVYFASRVVPSIKIVSFMRIVFMPLAITSSITIGIAFLLNGLACSLHSRLLFTFLIEIICVVLLWFISLSKSERTLLLKYAKIIK